MLLFGVTAARLQGKGKSTAGTPARQARNLSLFDAPTLELVAWIEKHGGYVNPHVYVHNGRSVQQPQQLARWLLMCDAICDLPCHPRFIWQEARVVPSPLA